MTDHETFELELTAMAHGGSALGRHGGKTIFVPYTIPGERVTARITEERGRIAFAEGITLLEASADRVYPRCPHFGPGRCGRCHWQHIDYAAQTLIKQDVLADQLARVGGFDDAAIDRALQPILASPVEWGYNVHMTMGRAPDGTLGFPRVDGRQIFPIEECHIIHPELLALRDRLELDFSGVEQVTLRVGSDGALMLILAILNEEDAPELEANFPASVNLLLPTREPVNLIGEVSTRWQVGDRSLRVTAGCEFRPNIAALPGLIDAVINALALTGREAVLDLFAGVGTFSAFTAPLAGLVTMVESYPPAANDAEVNLAEFDHVDVVEGAVEAVLPELDEHYDAVMLDPPNSGLAPETLDQIAALAIPRVVMVSGDPATLARDGQRLARKGYDLARVQPLDLNPQTYFIDAVAVFERRG
jgi:23S rRNA (uracil1939-C5)-methyltransferase